MSDRIHSDEFIFWVKATVGLQITKEGLYDFIKLEIQTLISLFGGDDAHFARFLNKIVFDEKRVKTEYTSRRGGNFKWTFRSNCKSKSCTNMFDVILEKHARKETRNINWRCHDPSTTISPATHWWIVAKFYMPDHNEQSTGPEQVDPLSLLSLLMNCKLFEKIQFSAQVVIDVRNALMHSASNTISEKDMVESFRKLKDLLREDGVKDTSKKELQDIEKLEHERMFLANTAQDDHEMIIKALELKQKALMHDISLNQNDEKPTAELEQLLEKTTQTIEQENISRRQREISRTEEIQKLRQRTSVLEEQCKTLQTTKHEELTDYPPTKPPGANQMKYDEEHDERKRIEVENGLLFNKVKTADENIRAKTEENENLMLIIAEMKQKASETKTKDGSVLESVMTGATAGSTVGLAAGLPGAVAGAAVGVVAAGTKAVVTKMLSRDKPQQE